MMSFDVWTNRTFLKRSNRFRKKGKTPVRMTQTTSSTRFRSGFWPFHHDGMARGTDGMKSRGATRRFSASLAPTGRCAHLRQNPRHDPADLPGSHGVPASLPRPIASLSQPACQAELIHDDAHDQTPALKLGGSSHMNPTPKQILFERARAMLMGEAMPIDRGHLRQGQGLIQAHKPTDAWVAFAVASRRSLHADETHLQVTSLAQMQVVPAIHLHRLAIRQGTTPRLIRRAQRLCTLGLQDRSIQRGPAFLACGSRRWSIPFAIAFDGRSITVENCHPTLIGLHARGKLET